MSSCESNDNEGVTQWLRASRIDLFANKVNDGDDKS